MRISADEYRLPTQEEDEQREFDDAYECVCLRQAVHHAMMMLGRDVAQAITEQEFQKNKRMH